jgi:hypothetical protein
MFKLTKLITLRSETNASDRQRLVDTLQTAARGNPRIKRAMLQPTLPGVANGGDYIWHVQFANEADYRAVIEHRSWRDGIDRALGAEPVAHVDSAAYTAGAGVVAERGIKGGVYRTLFTAIRPAAPVEKIVQFETEMCEMPRYITAIRNWGFSRVVEASGARQWAHVWEQDYRDVDGLTGPYMMHPFHWAFIDRWYDHESHDWIVDGRICHTFCAFQDSVIA